MPHYLPISLKALDWLNFFLAARGEASSFTAMLVSLGQTAPGDFKR
jgi:hypothetical protein